MKNFLAIVEIRTKIVSLSSLLIGFFLLLGQGGSLRLDGFILIFLSALCFDMATTALNSFSDYMRGTDRPQSNFEADKVLVHRAVPPGLALIYTLILYVLGGFFGLWLVLIVGWWILPWGILAFLVGVFYNIGPRPISSTPLGEVFAGGILGSLLVYLSLVCSGGHVNLVEVLVIVGQGIGIASILTVNNNCDLEADTQGGRLTLSIAFGAKLSPLLFLLERIAALVVIGFALDPGEFKGFFALALWVGASIILLNRQFKLGFRSQTKGRSMKLVVMQTLVQTIATIIIVV